MEQDYFASDELWETLQQAETDLIDAYASGELNDRQQQQFEGFFLMSLERRQRVGVALSLMNPAIRRELAGSLSQSSQSARISSQRILRRWNFLTAAAAIFLVVVAAVLWVQNHRLRSQLQSEQAALQHQHQSSNPTGAGTAPEIALAPSLVLLEPGLARGGSLNEQSVSAAEGQSAIVLMLDLRQDKYPNYDILVQTADGEMVQRFSHLNSQSIPHGRIVSIEFSFRQLLPGEYIVQLFGNGHADPLDSYVFSVHK